jgi:hypothetical protein
VCDSFFLLAVALASLRLGKQGEPLRLSLFWKCTIGIVFALLLVAFIGLSYMAGSPKDAYGMVRYAWPHMHSGKLKVGDDGPDVQLVALDGANRFHLRERTGARPLVVIFGSFT